jgi:hypothetical protein
MNHHRSERENDVRQDEREHLNPIVPEGEDPRDRGPVLCRPGG